MSERHNEHIVFIGDRRRRTRIDVLAIKDGLVLVQFNQKTGTYDFPGGGLNKGDTPTETAIREAQEEAGWICTDPVIAHTECETLFTGGDDRWYHQQGWHEELQIPVVCRAVEYRPGSAYHSEGDGGVFALRSLAEVVSGCRMELERNEGTVRRLMQVRIRIDVLDRQLTAFNDTVRSKYSHW